MKLYIGKHTGKDLEEIPLDYLIWFEANTNPAPALREAINAEIKIRTAEESSIGRSVESPTYVSFEEMLWNELLKWLIEQHTAKRLILVSSQRENLDKSLASMLKSEVPRLKKLHRSQSKNG